MMQSSNINEKNPKSKKVHSSENITKYQKIYHKFKI